LKYCLDFFAATKTLKKISLLLLLMSCFKDFRNGMKKKQQKMHKSKKGKERIGIDFD